MADLFSTDVLTAVITSLLGNPQFLLDGYFGTTQTETSEEIHFDTLEGRRRIAPLVSPLVEGQIVATLGFTTSTLKPAYIKDKRVFDTNRPLKRSPGERIGGSLSPADRIRALLAMDMQDQINMLNRRLEVMAGQVLTTGSLTLSGDKYPTVVLNFNRDPSLTVIPTILWSNSATAVPLDDLQDWAQIMLELIGAMATDVIMTVDVWKIFKQNPEVQAQLKMWRSYNQMPEMAGIAQVREGGVMMGQIAGFNIFVYSGWYIDPTSGVQTPIIPPKTVIMTSDALAGVRGYGAIRDEDIGLQALPYYVKSWVEPDPSVRFLLMQSAPIVFPYRPNASLCATVM
jgi:hypothetical protein